MRFMINGYDIINFTFKINVNEELLYSFIYSNLRFNVRKIGIEYNVIYERGCVTSTYVKSFICVFICKTAQKFYYFLSQTNK